MKLVRTLENNDWGGTSLQHGDQLVTDDNIALATVQNANPEFDTLIIDDSILNIHHKKRIINLLQFIFPHMKVRE